MRLERNPKKRKINPITTTKRTTSGVISLWKSSENEVDMYEDLFYKGVFTFLEGNELFKSCSRVSKRFKEMVELTRTKLVFGECLEDDSETLFSPTERFESAIKARQSGRFASVRSIQICGVSHHQFGKFICFNGRDDMEDDNTRNLTSVGLDWLEEIELIDLSNEASFELTLSKKEPKEEAFIEIINELTTENVREIVDNCIHEIRFNVPGTRGKPVKTSMDIADYIRGNSYTTRMALEECDLSESGKITLQKLVDAFDKDDTEEENSPVHYYSLPFVNLKSIKMSGGCLGPRVLLSVIFSNLHTLTTLKLKQVEPCVNFCGEFDRVAEKVAKDRELVSAGRNGFYPRSKLSNLVLVSDFWEPRKVNFDNPLFSMLTRLEITTNFTTKSFDFINGKNMPMLQKLSITAHPDCSIDLRDIGIFPLVSLKELGLHDFESEELIIREGENSELDFENTFPMLEKLDLSSSSFNDNFIVYVANGRLKRLKTLVLRETGIDEGFWNSLYGIERKKRVKSSHIKISNENGTVNTNNSRSIRDPFSNITDLDLSVNVISDINIFNILDRRFHIPKEEIDKIESALPPAMDNKQEIICKKDYNSYMSGISSIELGKGKGNPLNITLSDCVLEGLENRTFAYMRALKQ
jgi:hypothetical protein